MVLLDLRVHQDRLGHQDLMELLELTECPGRKELSGLVEIQDRLVQLERQVLQAQTDRWEMREIQVHLVNRGHLDFRVQSDNPVR